MKRPILSAVWLVLTCAYAAAAAAVDPPAAAPAATVETAAAVALRLAPVRWAPGSVVSRDEARVASLVAGRVVEVAEVGTRVTRGARIARLDAAAQRLRLEQVEAEIGRAHAQRDLAAGQAARFERLAGASAVAPAQIDEVRATAAAAEQELARARALKRAIEHELRETDIRAPFDGVVSERYAQRGEYVDVGAAVVHLIDTTRLEARVRAPLALSARLGAGIEVDVRMDGLIQRARVRTIVPAGDERSRQFELRVALPAGYAPVGSALEVALPEAAALSSLAVPRDALVLREAQTYVMRVRADGTAERVVVHPGVARDGMVEIDEGTLKAGDRVVVRGAERLAEGQRVSERRPG